MSLFFVSYCDESGNHCKTIAQPANAAKKAVTLKIYLYISINIHNRTRK